MKYKKIIAGKELALHKIYKIKSFIEHFLTESNAFLKSKNN